MGQRSNILGKPKKMEWRKIVPTRQRGQRWWRMSLRVESAPGFMGQVQFSARDGEEAKWGTRCGERPYNRICMELT